jgi:hypothetical protein
MLFSNYKDAHDSVRERWELEHAKEIQNGIINDNYITITYQ